MVYNLICRLHYGDQLDKTPRLLNAVKYADKRVSKLPKRSDRVPDRVGVYSVDAQFIVVLDHAVKDTYDSAQQALDRSKDLVGRSQRRSDARWKSGRQSGRR